MFEFLFIPLFAFLNRLRGGGWFASKLPSRPLYWVTLCVFCIACIVLNGQHALVFTASYFSWGVYAWGRWFDLGNMPELTRPIKPLEKIIERLSFDSDYTALTIRMAFASPFLAYLDWKLAVLFPFICVSIYAGAWAFWRDNPIPKAELAIGAVWGGMLLYLIKV